MASKKRVAVKEADTAQPNYDKLLKETEAVKRLLLLLFIKLDVSSKELGTALGVDGSVVRRMVPSSKIEKWFESGGKK